MYKNIFYLRKLYYTNLVGFLFIFILVFKYLAEKYLQKLKQQVAEDPEVRHSSSNKIGKYQDILDSCLPGKLISRYFYLLFFHTVCSVV